MKNPWEEINLDDYENHMNLESVNQIPTLNAMMKKQFDDRDVDNVMILGVAGGNGLEHIRPEKFKKVYGIDINEEYLKVAAERYAYLGEVLECIKADLITEADKLPSTDYLIANLLIEYIGVEAFVNVVQKTHPKYVSCIIQINLDPENWVSDSPYIHAFDGLDAVHHQMDTLSLSSAMTDAGYRKGPEYTEALPNGKALVRLDFLV
ncbi:MAG: class I SAM-dependent methyltransferase [Clostridiales bacterium]|nr:class I SAM-dependent methyltransferase [Clostridiales bacterium]